MIRVVFLFCTLAFWSPLWGGLCDVLTLEEKVGQLLMVHFRGNQLNPEAKKLINELKVGGIIYYKWANSLESPAQVHKLSKDLQNLCHQNSHPIPLLIAIDQEGGDVKRLTQGFTQFPSSHAIACAGDLDLARQCAYRMGRELKAVGININLAPVVDIAPQLESPIGSRSFGTTPECVTCFASAYIEGFHQAGVITTLKHFPGYGRVSVDSHVALPRLEYSLEELNNSELAPYYALAKKADTVMVGHILVDALDPQHCATLSQKTIQDLLRGTIGFTGPVLSDSLVMAGFTKNCSTIEEGAIAALNAGCDILILGGKQFLTEEKNEELTPLHIAQIAVALVDAVKKGVIPEARLNAAVKNILSLKQKYLLECGDHSPPFN